MMMVSQPQPPVEYQGEIIKPGRDPNVATELAAKCRPLILMLCISFGCAVFILLVAVFSATMPDHETLVHTSRTQFGGILVLAVIAWICCSLFLTATFNKLFWLTVPYLVAHVAVFFLFLVFLLVLGICPDHSCGQTSLSAFGCQVLYRYGAYTVFSSLILFALMAYTIIPMWEFANELRLVRNEKVAALKAVPLQPPPPGTVGSMAYVGAIPQSPPIQTQSMNQMYQGPMLQTQSQPQMVYPGQVVSPPQPPMQAQYYQPGAPGVMPVPTQTPVIYPVQVPSPQPQQMVYQAPPSQLPLPPQTVNPIALSPPSPTQVVSRPPVVERVAPIQAPPPEVEKIVPIQTTPPVVEKIVPIQEPPPSSANPTTALVENPQPPAAPIQAHPVTPASKITLEAPPNEAPAVHVVLEDASLPALFQAQEGPTLPSTQAQSVKSIVAVDTSVPSKAATDPMENEAPVEQAS